MTQLREAYRDPRALLADLGIEDADLALSAEAARRFPFRVPRAFAERMTRGDTSDPLLRQVLPLAEEDRTVAGYGADPLGEQAVRTGALLSKYRGRALLVATGACAVHCRYCFRREFPYGDSTGGGSREAAYAAIAADPDVHEVILSGGDPLVLDDAALRGIVAHLAAIAHVRRLRVHTRLPVVLPDRVTGGLLDALCASRLPVVLVIHANHPREIDAAVAGAVAACRAAGVTVLNQAVLLSGVNDDADTLAALSERLFEAGALPYYVHLLDRVAGSAHYEVDEATARRLEAALRARLPGYLVPRFVREESGAASKLPLALAEPRFT